MVVSSKTWAGSAKHTWTRCPRQAWPHGGLTMKHYRVLVGNHHQGYRSPCISHMISSYGELLLPEQVNQWLGVLGIHMEWRWSVYQTIEYFAHAWLTWDDSRGSKTNFHGFTAATYIKCTWIKGSHFFHPNIYFMNGAWRKCLHKFPTLARCSTQIMEETKCRWWAQQQLIGISISLDFHHYVNNLIVLVTTKM